jgi:hypothetical protein
MFVSCQGLRSLVEMLDENCMCPYSLPEKGSDLPARADQEGKDLVWMAVDGISRVFEMQVR